MTITLRRITHEQLFGWDLTMKRKNTKLDIDEAVKLAREILLRGQDVELRAVGGGKIIVYEVHKLPALKETGG